MVSLFSSSLFGPLVRLVCVALGFLLPGVFWVTWLLRGQGKEWLIRPARVALGFGLSFAVFSFLGWPFLWFRRSFAEFLDVLYPVWACYSLGGLALYFLTAPSPRRIRRTKERPANAAHSDEPVSRWPAICLCAYIAVSVGYAFLFYRMPGWRTALLIVMPLLLVPGFWVVRWLPRRFLLLPSYDPRDHQPPPRLWVAAAVAAVALQVVLIGLYNRPDWDDCYYLAAVLDYQHAPVLNAEEPTHRESLPVPTQHRTLCWELFGAVLAELTGLSPLSLFHTWLPMGLLILVYAAYTALLRELLPGRWVPLGILGLSAIHVYGISSHGAAANFVLPRLGQEKSVLLHVTIPLLVTLLLRFSFRPNIRTWAGIFITVLFGLGISLSAIFLLLALLSCLALSLAFVEKSHRERLQILFGAGVATLPLLVSGLLLQRALRHEVGLSAKPVLTSEWLSAAIDFIGRGTVEILWFLTLPFLYGLLRTRRARAYLLVFPALLFLTLGNPFLFDVIARTLTSYHTYTRILWLLPIAPGLAVLLALGCRFIDAAFLSRVFPKHFVHRPLLLALLFLLSGLLLPGIYVFGAGNNFLTPLGMPRLADNVEKIPGELGPIAARLAADPHIKDGRVLCNEQVASFLTPYSRDFRFVQTRALYTAVLFAGGGRTDEGIERALLASVLRRGDIPKTPERDDWFEMRILFGEEGMRKTFGAAMDRATRDVPALFARYHVRYIITAPQDKGDALFSALGFAPVEKRGDFTLWQAPQK